MAAILSRPQYLYVHKMTVSPPDSSPYVFPSGVCGWCSALQATLDGSVRSIAPRGHFAYKARTAACLCEIGKQFILDIYR